jgi:LPXTG-motif cell wall-anchored protein
MLQRLQTIYLALAFICIILLLNFPIFSITSTVNEIVTVSVFNAHGFKSSVVETESTPFYLLFIFMALFSLAGLFLYKKRNKQIQIVRLGLIVHILVAIGFLAFSLFGKTTLLNKLSETGIENMDLKFGFGLGYYLLFISIAFLLLAVRGIRADEKLVKSLDRLR